MKYLHLPISEVAQKVRTGQVKAEDVVAESLDRIQRLNPKYNAFVSVNPRALQEAKEIDAMVAQGKDPGPLAGIPVGVKDMLCTEGLKTTACSKILHNFVPPYSATVVKKLTQAGAIVVGKTNCDEFAMGSSNENTIFPVPQNPWKEGYVAGGSSGGSASAMAAKLCMATIGTDTGGSIRQPASFCGITGIKPTYGRVSRYGIIAFASSLDQAGPMTATVDDAAEILEVISGFDKHDSTSSQKAVPSWTKNKRNDLKGVRVGLPKEYFGEGLQSDVREKVMSAVEALKAAGATTVEVTLPNTSHSVSTYYMVATSEASSNLARYDGVRFGYRAESSDIDELYKKSRGEGFGKEVKRRIMLGTYALSSGYYDAFYLKASQVRRILLQDFMRAFEKVDVIVSPVTTAPAFKIGERLNNPLEMYLNDIYTTSTNLAGLPGMSVPGGLSKSGLPIGVQIQAPHFNEDIIFQVARFIEAAQKTTEKVPHGIQ